MCAKSYRKSNFWRHYQHFFVSFLLFLSILSYLCAAPQKVDTERWKTDGK